MKKNTPRSAAIIVGLLGAAAVNAAFAAHSIEKQIAQHREWIANPESKIPNFKLLDPRQQEALVNSKWPSDIARQLEQLDILRGLLGGN